MNKKNSIFIGKLFKYLPLFLREKLMMKARMAFPSKKITKTNDFVETIYNDVRCIWINKNQSSAGVMVFLHGGSYVFGPMLGQWKHYIALCEQSGFSGIVIDYRKAKTAPYPAAINDVKKALEVMHEKGDLKLGKWALIGDSAGGGLAAVVCRQLIDENKEIPASMILISPWVNMEHTHPEISIIEPKDPFINLKSINRSAALYANNKALNDPNLSPTNAQLKNMQSMFVIAGGIDALVPDMRIYVNKLLKAGVDVQYLEEPEEVHVYPMFLETPLAQKANKMIVQYLIEQFSDND